MTLRIIGIVLIVVSCGGFGFITAAAYRSEIKMLREFVSVLDYMECELQFRRTTLPELCRQASCETKGVIRRLFQSLTKELEAQISPDVEHCVYATLSGMRDIPKRIRQVFILFGASLGKFDVEGQVKGLQSVRMDCRRILEGLQLNQVERIRSYRTLGICAGVAVAILLL